MEVVAMSPLDSFDDLSRGGRARSRRRRPSTRALRALCGEPHPEDGIDPEELARRARAQARGSSSRGRSGASHPRPASRKALQLCGQFARTLNDVLASTPDRLVRDLLVLSVEPAPNESHLLVTVAPLPGLDPAAIPPSEVLGRLDQAAGRLRAEIASAITRRRAPALSFRFAVPDATQ